MKARFIRAATGISALILAAMAAALAGAGLLVAPQAQVPAGAAAMSIPLKVEPPEVVVEGNGATDVLFTLFNSGTAPVRVTHVVPYCGCTVTGLPQPQTVPAGGQSKLRVSATPPDVGERTTRVDVHYDGEPGVPLSINMHLRGREPDVPTLFYRPNEVIVRGVLGSTAENDFELSTVERRGADAWITCLESDSPRVTAAILGSEDLRGPTDDTLRRKYYCRVSTTLGARGRAQLALIRVFCDSTSGERSLSQLKVMSDCRASVEAIPDTVFWSVTPEDVPRDVTVRFRAASFRGPLSIEPKTTVSWLEIAEQAAPAEAASFIAQMRVRLVAVPDSDEGRSSRTTVIVKTSDPGCPVVEIPVVVHRRK